MKFSILILTAMAACVHAQGPWSRVGYRYENLARSILEPGYSRSSWNRNFPPTNLGLELTPQNDWTHNLPNDNLGLVLDQNNFNNELDQITPQSDFYTFQEIEDIRQRFERFRKAFDKFSRRFFEMLSRIQEHSHKRHGFINEPGRDHWPITWRMPERMAW